MAGLKALWLSTLDEDLSWRREGVEDDEFEELDQNIEAMQSHIAQALARGKPETFLPVVHTLLLGRGYQLAVSPEAERQLVLDLLPALQQGYDILAKRQTGRLVTPDLTDTSTPLQASWEPKPLPSAPRPAGELAWEALYAHWEQDRIRASSTHYDARRALNSLTALYPQATPVSLRRVQITDWLRHLRSVHGNGYNTLKKKAELVCAMYSSALKDELIQHNPFAGYDYKRFAAREGVEDPNERQSFNRKELQYIFSSEGLYAHPKRIGGGGYHARVWYSLLSLYTGARLGEIGRLTVNDVFDTPVPSIKIRRGKTRGSVREVPLHPDLVALGFFDYVQALRKERHVSLWPHLRTNSKKGTPSDVFGKWFNTYLHDRLGWPHSLSFHSLRHTFKDLCRDALISRELNHALTGHVDKKNVGDTYGQGFSIEIKHRELSKIKPGINIPSPAPWGRIELA